MKERRWSWMYELESEEAILEYLPLVRRVVRRLNVKSRDYEEEDLVNIGVIGLMDALKRFDDTKNVPFENYAYVRIKGTIIDEVRKTSRVPRSRMDKVNEFYKAKELLIQRFERTPTDQEIRDELNIDDKQLKAVYETVHSLSSVSLDEVLFQDQDSGATLVDFLEDQNSVNAEEKVLQEEQVDYLNSAVKQLSEREQTILQLVYVEELPLKEIAYIFDISVPRVSQIHGKTLTKLKELIGRNYVD